MPGSPEFTVLFVDDESSTLNALCRFLRREPYRILLAESGDKALEIMAQESVKILVTDLRMPGMGGLELLNHVALLYPPTIRIVISATTDHEEIQNILEMGQVFKFITKPLVPNELKLILREAIDCCQETPRLPWPC